MSFSGLINELPYTTDNTSFGNSYELVEDNLLILSNPPITMNSELPVGVCALMTDDAFCSNKCFGSEITIRVQIPKQKEIG
jgi:hypothetical protein